MIDFDASEFAQEMAGKAERALLDQLGEFIKRDLIVVEYTQPLITRDENKKGHTYNISQACKLVLKDQEYIEKLENQNKKLREIILNLKEEGFENGKEEKEKSNQEN